MRRRVRFLRKARELAYRDLGGLVFDLHRFGRRNDALVLAKLDTIGRIDGELRALEATLAERRAVTVLREAGVAACPRCAAIHGSDDRFCPNCGLAMDLRAERPVAGRGAGSPPPHAAPRRPPRQRPRRRRLHPGRPRLPAPAQPPHPPAPDAHPARAVPAANPPGRARTGRLPPTGPGPAHTQPAPAVQAAATGRGRQTNVDQPTEIVRPPAKDLERRSSPPPPPPTPATSAGPPVDAACPLCGAPLDPAQEWCLSCGAAARTRLAAPTNWKAPIVAIAVIATLALGVLAAALVKLSGGSGTTRTRRARHDDDHRDHADLPRRTHDATRAATTGTPARRAPAGRPRPQARARRGHTGHADDDRARRRRRRPAGTHRRRRRPRPQPLRRRARSTRQPAEEALRKAGFLPRTKK